MTWLLKDMAADFYRELFRADENAGGEFITGMFPKVHEGVWKDMEADVLIEET